MLTFIAGLVIGALLRPVIGSLISLGVIAWAFRHVGRRF